MPRSIWISTGEPSGDLHGGLLAGALKERDPALELAGVGGPETAAAGMDNVFSMDRLSVMGLTEVFAKLPGILGLLRGVGRELARRRPHAVVCIDAPAFNFRVARMAHRLGIPVYYYISPKLWAWNVRRVRFVQRYVRRMLCILPFEVDFYRAHGVAVDYVGNPLVDAIPWERVDALEPVPNRVGLLPGSRGKEIETLLPEFAGACRILKGRDPDLELVLVRAASVPEERLRALWPQDLELTVLEPESRYLHMRSCAVALAASGTVTLECALLGLPTILAYKMAPLSAALARRLIKVRYAGLPNLILDAAGKPPVFPELLQEHARADELAAHAWSWLSHPDALANVRTRLAGLRAMLGDPGAPERAADLILGDLT